MTMPSDMPASPYQRILFCTDFSDNAHHAYNYALDAAIRRPGCALYLLHVIPEPEAQFWKTYIYEVDNVDAKARADIDEKIQSDYRSRTPDSVAFQAEVRIGKDYQVILDYAREQRVDLIVLGRQGHSALEKVLFGNVTEKVVRKADCPVLVAPMSTRK